MVARKSGPLDAQLFMIRHLLFLREQIAPFDVEFAATDIDLDFSHMRDHLRRIMAGKESLFTLSSSNAVVRMLGQSGPRVTLYQVSAKRASRSKHSRHAVGLLCCQTNRLGLAWVQLSVYSFLCLA